MLPERDVSLYHLAMIASLKGRNFNRSLFNLEIEQQVKSHGGYCETDCYLLGQRSENKSPFHLDSPTVLCTDDRADCDEGQRGCRSSQTGHHRSQRDTRLCPRTWERRARKNILGIELEIRIQY